MHACAFYLSVCAKSLQLCLILCHSMDCSLPGSCVHGISRQEYWSQLPCPSWGNLSEPGIELTSPAASALQANSLPLSHQVSLWFFSFTINSLLRGNLAFLLTTQGEMCSLPSPKFSWVTKIPQLSFFSGDLAALDINLIFLGYFLSLKLQLPFLGVQFLIFCSSLYQSLFYAIVSQIKISSTSWWSIMYLYFFYLKCSLFLHCKFLLLHWDLDHHESINFFMEPWLPHGKPWRSFKQRLAWSHALFLLLPQYFLICFTFSRMHLQNSTAFSLSGNL